MEIPVKIGGREIALKWTQETAKRFHYRLSQIGGHPTQRELTGARTRDAAACKLLWAFLPLAELGSYPTPEDLYVAIDQETEGLELGKALAEMYAEMVPDAEKKSTLTKSPLPESSSE
jgi:hypothetical protein